MCDAQTDRSPAHRRGWYSAAHWCLWLVAGTIFYFADLLNRLFNLWILILPLIGIPAFVAVSTFVAGLVFNLWKRRWRKLSSVVAAPAVVVGLIAIAFHYRIDPDWFRFHLNRSYYMDLARSLPGPAPKYGEWSWGGTGGAASANISYSLVYDETDHPLDRPLKPGQDGATWSARPYGQHFFLVTELFQ